jgi:hypothetical protein
VSNDASTGPADHFSAHKPDIGKLSESSTQPPKRKRMRHDEPPIYARKANRGRGVSPVIPNRRPPIPKNAVTRYTQEPEDRFISDPKSPPPSAAMGSLARTQVNGYSAANGSRNSVGPSEQRTGVLGPWEPSITGLMPHEEITKVICDFLFEHVVGRRDIGAAAAGAAATGPGAILEVEAKFGQLIDKDRGGRLHLPVLTECVVNRGDPALRTSFESSMTPVSASSFS